MKKIQLPLWLIIALTSTLIAAGLFIVGLQVDANKCYIKAAQLKARADYAEAELELAQAELVRLQASVKELKVNRTVAEAQLYTATTVTIDLRIEQGIIDTAEKFLKALREEDYDAYLSTLTTTEPSWTQSIFDENKGGDIRLHTLVGDSSAVNEYDQNYEYKIFNPTFVVAQNGEIREIGFMFIKQDGEWYIDNEY